MAQVHIHALGTLCIAIALGACAGTAGRQPPEPQGARNTNIDADQQLEPADFGIRRWRSEQQDLALTGAPGTPAARIQLAYGSPRDEMAYDIWPSGDGGFVLTGSTATDTPGNLDLVVMKTDDAGVPAWAWQVGGPRLEIGFAVRTLTDDTVVVAGWTHSIGAGAGDFLLLGFRADGLPLFQTTFGGAGEERATALLVLDDDSLAILGESYSHGAGDSRFYLVRTDARGNPLMERTYDSGPLHDRGLALIEFGDGLLLAGNSMDARSGGRATVSDGYAVRVDTDGDVVWARHYGAEAHDIVHHVAALDDGHALLTGYTRGYGASGENDLWLVRVDAAGEVVDSRLLGGSGADHNIVARRVADGVLLAGYTRSAGIGGWDAQVLQVDRDLATRFDYAWGGPADDGATSVLRTVSGALAITGYTASGGAGGNDILLLITRD